MPYNRKYKKRSEKNAVRRFKTYGNAGVQAYKDVKYLKTLINAELHFHVGSLSDNIDNIGNVWDLSSIPQGDGDNHRTGTSVLPRYQSIYFHVNKAIAAGPTHETIRLICFRYWGEQSSAAPSISPLDVLTTLDPLSFLNDNNTGKRGDRERRIEIHKSKLFTLDQVSDTSRTYRWNIEVNGPNKQVKDHIKFRSATTEGPISGGFYMFFISDNATGANKSSITLKTKLNFYDN